MQGAHSTGQILVGSDRLDLVLAGATAQQAGENKQRGPSAGHRTLSRPPLSRSASNVEADLNAFARSISAGIRNARYRPKRKARAPESFREAAVSDVAAHVNMAAARSGSTAQVKTQLEDPVAAAPPSNADPPRQHRPIHRAPRVNPRKHPIQPVQSKPDGIAPRRRRAESKGRRSTFTTAASHSLASGDRL